MNPDKAVVLKTYSMLSCAETAAATLRARGIECLIQSDDCGGMLGPLSLEEGIRLVVDAENEAGARELLDASAPDAPAPA